LRPLAQAVQLDFDAATAEGTGGASSALGAMARSRGLAVTGAGPGGQGASP